MAFHSLVRTGVAGLILGLACAPACRDSSNPPDPAPGVETITGRERIGWSQTAVDAAQLATFEYAIYIDGTRGVLTGATCPAAGSGTFACSAAFPPMTPGPHTIELTSFTTASGVVIESDRSAPLRVSVAASSAPADTALPASATIVTSEGHRLQAAIAARGLNDPTDLAIGSDGRIFVAERAGRVRVLDPTEGGLQESPALELDDVAVSEESGLTAIALHPDFDRNGHVYLAYTTDARDGPVFRLARFRERNGILAQGATIAREREFSNHVVIRFGPDGRLYAAFSAGDDPREASSAAGVRGKILRLNDDGTTPDDNPRAAAAFSSGHRDPRALAWHPSTRALWELERDRDSGDELNTIVGGADYGWPHAVGGTSPAGSLPASLVLAAGTDVSGASFVPPGTSSPIAGELLVASRGAEDLLRIRVGSKGDRPGLVEGLLQGRYGRIAAVAVTADGTIYVATANRDAWGPGRDVLIRISVAPAFAR